MFESYYKSNIQKNSILENFFRATQLCDFWIPVGIYAEFVSVWETIGGIPREIGEPEL